MSIVALIVAAVAASPLCPADLRDAGLVLIGMVLAIAIMRSRSLKASYRSERRRKDSRRPPGDDSENQEYMVQTIEELRELMPAKSSGTCIDDAKKVIGHLDDQMIDFITKSPLIYLATLDTTTMTPFVSPKGDDPGFVSVIAKEHNGTPVHTLVIPDRPGNRLIFGLQNIVGQSESKSESESEPNNASSSSSNSNSPTTKSRQGAQVSVLFEVPRTGATLRCGGTARLSIDPALLKSHTARGCDPKLVILVDVDHAFFHCAKAYMRSKVWDPTSWPSDPLRVTFGQYFAKKETFVANMIDSSVDKHYQEVQEAINGNACEKED